MIIVKTRNNHKEFEKGIILVRQRAYCLKERKKKLVSSFLSASEKQVANAGPGPKIVTADLAMNCDVSVMSLYQL